MTLLRTAALLGATALCVTSCGGHKLPPMDHCAQATDHVVSTEDGASVHLHRHAHTGPPVLLVHGLGSRGQYWDLSSGQSMAEVLNAAGFDAWTLDLRGHGGHREDADGDRLSVGWTLDDYGRYDLPAAIDHIRETTGHDRVRYVGHSMGGMVAAVYNAWHGDDKLDALVIVGSPVDFHHAEAFQRLSTGALSLGRLLPSVHSEVLAKAVAGRGRLPYRSQELLYNADNLDDQTRRDMFHRGAGPVTRGEMRHLQHIMADGDFTSLDGETHYVDSLASLDVPLLVIAGRADGIAPPDRVWPFYDRAGSADKSWVVAGRAEGFSADYGHLDLTAGVHAPTEIHPLITGFLSRSTPSNDARGAPGAAADADAADDAGAPTPSPVEP